MQLIDITQAQTQLPDLMQIALTGEEIIITRDNITRDNLPILKLRGASHLCNC